MLKTWMTFTLLVFALISTNLSEAQVGLQAKSQEGKASIKKERIKGEVKKSKKYKNAKKNIKKNKKKKSRSKAKRYKKRGKGPDLRALTTETPNTEYTEAFDNGVNSVETKTGL